MMSFECVTLAVLLSRVTEHCKRNKSSYSCFTTRFRLHIQKLTTSMRIIPHTSTEQVSPTHPDRGTKQPQHKGIPMWEASLISGASSPRQRWKKKKKKWEQGILEKLSHQLHWVPAAPDLHGSTSPPGSGSSPLQQCAPTQRALNAILTKSFVHLLVLKKIGIFS